MGTHVQFMVVQIIAKQIILWKKSMCELHGQMHDQCPCLFPYRLHVMPSKESIRLEWNKALNRKELPKKVFVCSEHFIDGKPTDRNPYPFGFLDAKDLHKLFGFPIF